jgi:hypothetical protein
MEARLLREGRRLRTKAHVRTDRGMHEAHEVRCGRGRRRDTICSGEGDPEPTDRVNRTVEMTSGQTDCRAEQRIPEPYGV